jgi:hypothetical protein
VPTVAYTSSPAAPAAITCPDHPPASSPPCSACATSVEPATGADATHATTADTDTAGEADVDNTTSTVDTGIDAAARDATQADTADNATRGGLEIYGDSAYGTGYGRSRCSLRCCG